jgi:2-dehydropantoate 2-reductase
VKSYGLEEVISFLQRVASKETVIIPILNGIDVSERIAQRLDGCQVIDGSIYIYAHIEKPGEIVHSTKGVRITMGKRGGDNPEILKRIAADLEKSQIGVKISENIAEDLVVKFMYMSPKSCVGIYHGALMGRVRSDPGMRADYLGLLDDLCTLADAMGIESARETREKCIRETDAAPPDTCTSMYRDVTAGRPAEYDTILFAPVKRAKQYGVFLPTYHKVAVKFGYRD